jgi:serine/threonine protein phosphatase PrpC
MYLDIEQHTIANAVSGQSASCQVETLLEKGSGHLNEDVLLNDGTLYGVFDGATSLVRDTLPEGLSGGFIAARIAADAFSHNARTRPLSSCAEMANSMIGLFLRAHGVQADQRHRLWSTSAAVVRLRSSSFDYCQIGDSLIFCLYENGSYRQLTPDTNHDQRTLCLWKKANPMPGATIHDTLAEEILKVRLQMNSAYGVLNGEPEAMPFLRCGRESLDGVQSILLFTDGLFPPQEDPCAETDWQEFIGLYRQGGLTALRDKVRSVQKSDPECRKYPRFKMHDDIAAISLIL